jgi:hypothetical protein
MKRNTVLIVLVALAAVVLFFDPFKIFSRKPEGLKRPVVAEAALAPLLRYAESAWSSPEDYIIASFKNHDIVMLGEFFKIRENVNLVRDLIPRLYAAGIDTLGIEYALSDSQADIDALTTADAWNESKARAITFDWLVTWGYQEYVDLYKAAWQVNRNRPAGAPPFRIIGLNVRQNWGYLKSARDINDPKIVAQIFSNGVPDQHMAETILKQIAQKGGKALVYASTQHVFTRYRNAEYAKNAVAMKLAETRRAGNIVYDAIGPRVFSISLHAPWPDKGAGSGLTYAAGGAIDALIDSLPAGMKSGGWDTAGTPLGALPVKASSYGAAGNASTLADVFDGYIVQGPIAQYTVVTPIKDFVQPADAARAAREFPGVKRAPPTVEQINLSIQDDVQAMAKTLAQFK